jgi:hypothetical protein
MDATQKSKNLKDLRKKNVLESLKDIGSSSTQSVKKDLLEKTSQEFIDQLLGRVREKKYSGELTPGESVELKEVFSGRAAETKKLNAQLTLERRLREEEKTRVEERSNTLRLQLHALMEEVLALAQSTQGLGEEVEIAAMQAPVKPGEYHIVFFEKLLSFIRSFRERIEESSLWLHSSNKRAARKNYWAMYKKKGSSFLLAPDHYLQRSAG